MIKRICDRESLELEVNQSTKLFLLCNQALYQLEYDGASKGNPGSAGAGALLRHPDGTVVCVSKFYSQKCFSRLHRQLRYFHTRS